MKYLTLLLIGITLSACTSTVQLPANNNLYEEIGGQQTLSKVFGLALTRIYNDPIIGHHFTGVPKSHLRKHLTAQTCELIGGPCVYQGKDMVDVHTDHNITDKEFFILVEYVQGAMRDIGLTVEQENQILQKLAPLKGQIVYR